MILILQFVAILVFISVGIIYFWIYFYQPFFLVKIIQEKLPNILFYVPTRSNYFAITFDDGPDPAFTDQILDILDKYDANATFFLLGNRIEKHPEYVKIIKQHNHQIANHTYRDESTLFLSEDELVESLRKTEKFIDQKISPKLFRPGSGWISSKLLKVAKDAGYQAVIGSAYVSDAIQPSRWYMRKALTSLLRPGIIIILHDGSRNTQKVIDILPDLLEKAREKNLKPVTLNTLINSRKKSY